MKLAGCSAAQKLKVGGRGSVLPTDRRIARLAGTQVRDMPPRIWLLTALLLAGCNTVESGPACGTRTAPLPAGSSMPVEVPDGPAGLGPVSANGALYGPKDPSPAPTPLDRVTQLPGVVTNTGGELILRLEDGREVELTLYFCD